MTSNSLNTFTAQAVITLAASTTYWLTVNEEISSNRARVFYNSGNDQTGETGWSIGDGSPFRNGEMDSWSDSLNSLLIAIKGTVVPCDGIWCATLTVQGLGSFDKGCDNTQDSTKHCSVLLDPSNTFSHAGVNYTIEKVRDQNGSGNLEIWVTPDIATGSENLVFHVDDDSYAFQEADQKAGEYRKWEGINYPWGTGNEVSLKLTEGLTNATGDPTIDGVPQVGMMLAADTSDIEDVDGLPATFTYQWVRIATDTTATNLGTNSTHTVSSLDEGSTIRVDVSFTDLAGNSEGPLPSAATPAVVPAAASCPAGNDWCATIDRGDIRNQWDILRIQKGFLRTA